MIENLTKEWKNIIENYIDGLNEKDKLGEYRDELVSVFLSKKLLQAKVDNTENVELKKRLIKIQDKPATSNNRKEFESCYHDMLNENAIGSFNKQLDKIYKKTNFYNIWICRAIESSEGILPATHCAKLSHSSSSGSSILDRTTEQDNCYITTSSLRTELLDGTYLDAKYSKQIKFLMLQNGTRYLFDELSSKSKAGLRHFADDQDELDRWISRYHKILNTRPSTDALLKQIYFPVSDNYHLLSILKSSSIAQYLHQSHFSKDARKQRDKYDKALRNKKFLPDTYKRALNVNNLMVTQSQPQNASILNGKRGGVMKLLKTAPPIWNTQLIPPIHCKSWFSRGIPYSSVKDDIEYLRAFLLRNEKLALSTRHPDRRKWLIKWGMDIIDTVLYHAQNIQSLPSGWSQDNDIKLKQHQQYFLDPNRDDKVFQRQRKTTDWQKKVCDDFATWLNGLLRGRDKKFTPQKEHRKLWSLLMSHALRNLAPVLDIKESGKKVSDV
ncbi:type I-F CRISPR-associated protein Csy1 [Agarilytica rhodophyticola]|uniref:type I-F CRISPR-associated protein Csy1 n=1 Tax=Agarilytica rhodophyticola TaxID=1737490 RepID=UPI000B346E4A|nr:type I-F CRISPR-associated protein Csy1 [Agarilytica rhodophyticola]